MKTCRSRSDIRLIRFPFINRLQSTQVGNQTQKGLNLFHNRVPGPTLRIIALWLKIYIYIYNVLYKVTKRTPILKAGEHDKVSNYRFISVLPCFSKIMEMIMYNRPYVNIYKYITNLKKSKSLENKCGVLQGSILRPLLF